MCDGILMCFYLDETVQHPEQLHVYLCLHCPGSARLQNAVLILHQFLRHLKKITFLADFILDRHDLKFHKMDRFIKRRVILV